MLATSAITKLAVEANTFSPSIKIACHFSKTNPIQCMSLAPPFPWQIRWVLFCSLWFVIPIPVSLPLATSFLQTLWGDSCKYCWDVSFPFRTTIGITSRIVGSMTPIFDLSLTPSSIWVCSVSIHFAMPCPSSPVSGKFARHTQVWHSSQATIPKHWVQVVECFHMVAVPP